ncbi:MAG: FIG00733200: hypothetical protein, partial [uncultured Blastococcus sp.]
ARSLRRCVRRPRPVLAVALVDAAVHRRVARRPVEDRDAAGMAPTPGPAPRGDGGGRVPTGRSRTPPADRRPDPLRRPHLAAALAGERRGAAPPSRRSRRRAAGRTLVRRADVPGLRLGGDARPGRAGRRAGRRDGWHRRAGSRRRRRGGGRPRRPPGMGGGGPADRRLRAPLRMLPAAADAGGRPAGVREPAGARPPCLRRCLPRAARRRHRRLRADGRGRRAERREGARPADRGRGRADGRRAVHRPAPGTVAPAAGLVPAAGLSV